MLRDTRTLVKWWVRRIGDNYWFFRLLQAVQIKMIMSKQQLIFNIVTHIKNDYNKHASTCLQASEEDNGR